MRVKFGTGTKDVPISEVNAANYIVPEGEEGSYHVKQEITTFHQKTGKRLSVPRIQKYGAKEYQVISRNLKQQGYDIEVLYDPTDWLREQAEKREELKAMTVQKKRELEQKRREAEKAAMKAEIIEELKAAGIIPAKAEKEPKTEKKTSNKK